MDLPHRRPSRAPEASTRLRFSIQQARALGQKTRARRRGVKDAETWASARVDRSGGIFHAGPFFSLCRCSICARARTNRQKVGGSLENLGADSYSGGRIRSEPRRNSLLSSPESTRSSPRAASETPCSRCSAKNPGTGATPDGPGREEATWARTRRANTAPSMLH